MMTTAVASKCMKFKEEGYTPPFNQEDHVSGTDFGRKSFNVRMDIRRFSNQTIVSEQQTISPPPLSSVK